MQPIIVVVGSLNMDFVVKVKRLPAPGETTLGHGFQMIPGGKGANQACAVGKLGGDMMSARMVGRVGYDVFADHLRASLSAAGVDVTAVHATRAQPTGVALIWVDAEGQNSIVVASGANFDFPVTWIENVRRSFAGAQVALFQLETPLDTVARALEVAREEGAATILDPAPAQKLPHSILQRVDVLTPNESEACILLSMEPCRISPENVQWLARDLRALGPRAVIVKLGEQGCYYSSEDRELYVPGFKVDAVDTTAAGDTFNAAFAVATAEAQPLEQALRFANAAAALSVTRPGAQSSVPSRHEVDAFLKD